METEFVLCEARIEFLRTRCEEKKIRFMLWVSNLFITKRHTGYCRQFTGRIWTNSNKWYTKPPKLLCNFYSSYTNSKFGRGPRVGDSCLIWKPLMCIRPSVT